jgi:hypothetical protein
MIENRGSCPGAAKGKRIRARLFNGAIIEAPADGPQGVNWSAKPHPFHIKEFEII